MDIVELIKREHGKTSSLFEKLADTSTGAVKTRERLFNQLKTGIEAHGKVVQDLVYPLLRKQEETRDLIPDLKERNEIKRQLADLDRTPKEDEEFLPKLKELKKLVEQHLRAEQRQIFPAVKKGIGGEEAEELAKRIEAETREELQEAVQDDDERRNGRGRAEEIGQISAAAPRRFNAAQHFFGPVSRSAERVAEEGAETAQEAVTAGASEARRMADTATRQIEQAAQSLQGATQIYAETNLRAQEAMRTLMVVPTAAAGAMKEMHRAWADLLSQSVNRGARATQEIFRCSTAQQLAAVHRQYLDELMTGWLESNVRVLQGTRRAVDEALRPIQEEVERAHDNERGRGRRRSRAA